MHTNFLGVGVVFQAFLSPDKCLYLQHSKLVFFIPNFSCIAQVYSASFAGLKIVLHQVRGDNDALL